MSLWRAKRRQTITRRFREQAEESLLAINLLEAEAAEVEIASSRADVARQLTEGAEFLEMLRDALNSPANADDHHYALAKSLMRRWSILEDEAAARLEVDAAALERAATDLEFYEALNRAKETLKDIERISVEASEEDESTLRKHFAY